MKKYKEYLQGKNKDYNRSLIDALEDDRVRCVQCGGIRVAGSTLCKDCLVDAVGEKLEKIDRLVKENKVLDEKCEKLRELCERLLDHITADAIDNTCDDQARFRAWAENKGGF